MALISLISTAEGEPLLPEDLERLIFELTAFLYPELMPSLLLVTQRVKAWIEPLLYQVLYHIPNAAGTYHPRRLCDLLETRPADKACIQARMKIVHRFTATFFHDHVRHVWLTHSDPDDEIIKLIVVCDSTVNLKVSFYMPPDALLTLLGSMRVHRLSGYMPDFLHGGSVNSADLSHPSLAQITHLEFSGGYSVGWDTWSGLAQMSRLTHLAFLDSFVLNSVAQGALAHCKTLEVLVIVHSTQRNLDRWAPRRAQLATDPRYVALVVPDMGVDWVVGARGGEDFWAVADAVVRNRCSEETGQLMLH
ncbi:hypothetical protein FB451DRAFT_1492243 [Mycena latifolia]|nr:hypothetical protein FB451DRAFT_1492243 [Mycena latifolia]